MIALIPQSFIALFALLFGIIIGSFLNVLILRYNTGKGLGGRSMCFSCGRTLQGRDLVPVLSFLWQRGRCRTCKSKISLQYVFVELLTGILFVFTYLHNVTLLGQSSTVFITKLLIDWLLVSTLVFMTFYDMRHKIIPDPAVILSAVLALVGHIVTGGLTWSIVVSGFILAIPFYLIWLLSKGTWMGLGDAKLAIAIGWILGLSAGGTAIILGFWIGALFSVLIIVSRPETGHIKRFSIIVAVSILLAYYIAWYSIVFFVFCYGLYLFGKSRLGKSWVRRGYIPHLGMKSEIPFAPFLIIGLLIVYFLGYNLFTLTLI